MRPQRAFRSLFLPARVDALLRRFRADMAGAVAVIVAITAPVLIGMMGLGSEAGYWYLTQRNLQNAADMAAHGAGRRVANGAGDAERDETADYLVARAGIDLSAASVSVSSPPASGDFAGDDKAIEVVVTESVPRMFSRIWSKEPVAITARAVALVQAGGTGCVLALSRTAQGAITISGSAGLSLANCNMISNAEGTSLVMQGNGSSATVQCIQTVGTAQTTRNLSTSCDAPRENASAVPDPFEHIEEPALEGPCNHSGMVGRNNQATLVSPDWGHASGMRSKRFCNGLTVQGTVVFDPGLYLIEGGEFRINSNAQISGDEVVFFLAEGVTLHFNGTADVDLSAPTTGPYSGMLIFGSRESADVSHRIDGNFGSHLDGAIYAPQSHLTLSGNAQAPGGGCTQIVTETVEFTGNGTIDLSCENPAGPSITLLGNVALVE